MQGDKYFYVMDRWPNLDFSVILFYNDDIFVANLGSYLMLSFYRIFEQIVFYLRIENLIQMFLYIQPIHPNDCGNTILICLASAEPDSITIFMFL